jgi:hypothetical protein
VTFTTRHVVAGVVSSVLLAPALAVVVLLVRDLRHRPAARVPVVVVGEVDLLIPGRSFDVLLAPTDRTYRALVVTPQLNEGTANLTLSICSGGEPCISAVQAISDREPFHLRLPSPMRRGKARVSVLSATGPRVTVQRWSNGPAIQALVGYSWSLPFERAHEFWRAYTASSGLGVALALHGLVVFAGVVISIRMSFGRDRDS